MITIIDYKSGNPQSVIHALNNLGIPNRLSSDPAQIATAEKLIFPGQGRARQAMEALKELNLIDTIKNYKNPFLGICIGMQLLTEYSEEDEIECLALIPGRVKKFTGQQQSPSEPPLKVPQVGWNTIEIKKETPITKEIPQSSYFYFVNSYYAQVPPEYSLAQTTYGETADTIINKNNFYGVQFHTEKSATPGLQLLKNFATLSQ